MNAIFETELTEAQLAKALARFNAANKPPFRGGIVENCQRFAFRGSGYDAMPKEQHGHFWIESARQCAGPMAALTDDDVRVVHTIGATQVLKSMAGDAWVIYVVEHVRASMLVLFEDDGKADLFCSRRLMETIRQHPHLQDALADSTKESRHNVTGTWIKFRGHELLVAGLNEGNVSTLSWQLVWVSEAWQHGSDGLLFKAFKRADRYPDTSKILNESQASVAGTDLHRAVLKAHPVPLVWRCPACDGRQTWEWQHWSYKRPDDFKARLTLDRINRIKKDFPETYEAEIQKEIEERSKALRGTYAGMRIPDETVEENGQRRTLSLDERADGAAWECIRCGHILRDEPAVRKAICATYEQNYKLPSGISPREVWFTIPFEAAWDNKFAKTVKNFLVAKRAQEQGNHIPMQDWMLSERALFYDRGQTLALEMQAVVGSYDPNEQIPNQHSVNLLVDVQKKLDAGPEEDVAGSFWAIVEAVDKLGNSFDKYRGFLTSWEEVIALQKRFKIPNGRVCVDGRKWTPAILRKAAENFEWVERSLPQYPGRKFRLRQCWMIFMGDDAAYFRWGKVSRPYSMPHEHKVTIIENNQPVSVSVYLHLWSNLSISDQMSEILMGGEGLPKVEILKREQLDERTREKEQGDLTYQRQINAEYRTTRRGKPFWEKKRADNHYLDCRKMGLVRKMMDGLAGSVIDTTAGGETPPADGEQGGKNGEG